MATETTTEPVTPPTIQQFAAYQRAYDYFNASLFGGQLKPCLLVFREGRKTKNSIVLGHFAWDRWKNEAGDICHEISLNPEALRRDLDEVMGTLVHEMVHQWQQDHGKPPKGGYHDKQWAHKMCEVGLIPSHTGQAGGKMTGPRMTHYNQTDGPFARSFAAMPAEVRMPWTTGFNVVTGKGGADGGESEKKSRNKIKYECGCGSKVWGKPDLNVICGECEDRFESNA